MRHLALRQRIFDKDGIDRLQIEFRWQIHDGTVFVIEFTVFSCRIAVAADKMIKKLQIRDDVAIDIHRHEARELQKTRVNLPSTSRVTKGYDADAIALKPCAATLLREKIDLGRASPRVDRTAHQRNRNRNVRA